MESSHASRDKFRRLAVLDLDPDAILGSQGRGDNMEEIVQAIKTADAIFWRQIMPQMDRQTLLEQAGDDDELKEMLIFNYGPYDRLNHNAPLLPVAGRPPGAGFYPADLSRNEFSDYVRRDKESGTGLESPYTVVRRTTGGLRAIPFHEAYEDLVTELSDLLLKAASKETHPAFREFLRQRARDVSIDDFHASDTLWVNLNDNPIDLVIGPYEVYEDELLGLKAAYEAFLLRRNFADSAKIQHFQHELPKMCASLERQLGRRLTVEQGRVRISVADLAYAGGDAHKAIPAIAFSLPNDERTIEEVGARQIILRNVLEAKFQLVGWKILGRVLRHPPADKENAFQSFFNFTLLHEIAHPIGPHRIVKDGEETTVNRCLRQHHSVLEEAKADILAAALALNVTGVSDVKTFVKTYVGGLLRPIRFGFGEAHGGSNTIQFNYLLRAGAIFVDNLSGKISVDEGQFNDAVCKLAANILNIQEGGDFHAAERFIASFRVLGPELEKLIRNTEDLPVDIRIRFRGEYGLVNQDRGEDREEPLSEREPALLES